MLLDVTTFLGDKTVALPQLHEKVRIHRKMVERRITAEKNVIHVGVGEIGFGMHARDVIRITALGSCVGLILISKSPRNGNVSYFPTFLAHIMLPSKRGSQVRMRKTFNDASSSTRGISKDPTEATNLRLNEEYLVLKTYGVEADDVERHVVTNRGSLQWASPSNGNDHESVKLKNRGKYADIAIPFGIDWFRKRGLSPAQLEAFVIGGARMFPTQDGITSNIGALNVIQSLKELAKHDIKVRNVFAGGVTRKAIIVFIETGEIYVRDGDDQYYYRLK